MKTFHMLRKTFSCVLTLRALEKKSLEIPSGEIKVRCVNSPSKFIITAKFRQCATHKCVLYEEIQMNVASRKGDVHDMYF